MRRRRSDNVYLDVSWDTTMDAEPRIIVKNFLIFSKSGEVVGHIDGEFDLSNVPISLRDLASKILSQSQNILVNTETPIIQIESKRK